MKRPLSLSHVSLLLECLCSRGMASMGFGLGTVGLQSWLSDGYGVITDTTRDHLIRHQGSQKNFGNALPLAMSQRNRQSGKYRLAVPI